MVSNKSEKWLSRAGGVGGSVDPVGPEAAPRIPPQKVASPLLVVCGLRGVSPLFMVHV